MSKHFKLLIFDHSRKASHLFETKINAYFCASQKTQKICKKLKEAFNLFFFNFTNDNFSNNLSISCVFGFPY